MRQSRGRGARGAARAVSGGRHARAGLAGFVFACTLALSLAGCAPFSQTMTDAAAQGRSAVETASLALELEQDGRSIFGLTATAFDDAERELSDAAALVDEADVSTEADRALRAETTDALRHGLDAVNAARESLQGVTDPDAVAEALDEASAQLDALVQAGAGR